MKKILYGILMLFLVALVPSVIAAAPVCGVTNSVLTITGSTVTLPHGTTTTKYVSLGENIAVSVDLENTGTIAETPGLATDFTVSLYDNTGTTMIDTKVVTFAIVAPGDGTIDPDSSETETFDGIYLMPSTIPSIYDANHNFMIYIEVDDNTNFCTMVSDTIIVNNGPNAIGGLQSSNLINEDDTLSLPFTASDPDTVDKGDSLSYAVKTTTGGNAPSGLNVVSTGTGGTITWTPNNDNVGNHNLVLTGNDGFGGETSRTFSVSVTNTNDAPTFTSMSNHLVQEDIAMSDIVLNAATDVDLGDVVTYSLNFVGTQPEESTFLLTYFNPTTRTISGWVPDKEDVGELKLRLTATDLLSTTATADFSINVYPKTMCEEGEVGNGNVVGSVVIDKPDDGDDFGPGDTINIEVTVENDAGDDKDFIVEAVLYDVETHKKVADVESDDENIDEDDDFTFKLELEIPLDSDEEYKGDYIIYVKAYEDGKEDEQCSSELVEINIGRESHDVIVQSMTISPSTVAPGETIDVSVRVANIGKKDEEGVTVKLREQELGIDVTSDARDLTKFDESGNSYVFRFTGVQIPADANAKEFELEAFVLFDDDSSSNDYLDSPTYKRSETKITVEGDVVDTDNLITVGKVEESAKGILTIPVTVSNPEGKILTIELNADWAEEVKSKTIVEDGQTVYFDLELNDEAEEGTEIFTVQVKASNGDVVDSSAKTVSLTDDMIDTGFSLGSGSTILWIIGDIVLIIVAVFFIKLIFSGRKRLPKVKEVKL